MARKLFFLFLISTILLLGTCKKEDSSNDFYQQISSETLKWLGAYESEGQELLYVNSSNDTVGLTIRNISNSTTNYIDCNRDGQTVQCNYQSVGIDFPEEFNPPNKNIVVSITLIANYDVRIMPTLGGLVVSAGRLNDDTKELWTESDTHFQASYVENFSFQGSNYEAIVINTLTTENLPTGGQVLPQRLVYGKNGGILTWDDYDGVTWNLVQ